MIASKKGHADVVKYLLGRPNVQVNVAEIHIYEKFIKFPINHLWNFFRNLIIQHCYTHVLSSFIQKL